MKSKKKHTLNLTFVEQPYRRMVNWKCNICESMFGTFGQLKMHKYEIHAH